MIIIEQTDNSDSEGTFNLNNIYDEVKNAIIYKYTKRSIQRDI